MKIWFLDKLKWFVYEFMFVVSTFFIIIFDFTNGVNRLR